MQSIYSKLFDYTTTIGWSSDHLPHWLSISTTIIIIFWRFVIVWWAHL